MKNGKNVPFNYIAISKISANFNFGQQKFRRLITEARTLNVGKGMRK